MTTSNEPTGIDPRGPRFGASITAVLLLAIVFLALSGAWVAAGVLQFFVTALFAWGWLAGIQSHPYGLFFAKVIRPRLRASAEREDPRPPTFAQFVGFVVTASGVVLAAVFDLAYAIPVTAGLAFIAAFLNAAFGYCLGCQIWLLLARAGAIKA